MTGQRNLPVMLVTGASRGIGAAIARLAAEAGYTVVVNYAASADMAKALA
ncbi:MAG: short chain dehydrogenase, partial [Ilumatobacteraceae bacterium]